MLTKREKLWRVCISEERFAPKGRVSKPGESYNRYAGCNKPVGSDGKETGEVLRKGKVGTSATLGSVVANQVVTLDGVGPLDEDGRRAVMVALKRTRRVEILGICPNHKFVENRLHVFEHEEK